MRAAIKPDTGYAQALSVRGNNIEDGGAHRIDIKALIAASGETQSFAVLWRKRL